MFNAFRFEAPPHGGLAPGIDRIVKLLANEPNIREVIAFPLNQHAEDLMMNAPSTVSDKQLQELHIRIVEQRRPLAGRSAAVPAAVPAGRRDAGVTMRRCVPSAEVRGSRSARSRAWRCGAVSIAGCARAGSGSGGGRIKRTWTTLDGYCDEPRRHVEEGLREEFWNLFCDERKPDS